MEGLIPLINKIQDICENAAVKIDLDLPKIVVIGTQSSGKSSVIESIVKREFLPRGSGLVTRRPLIIRLLKVDNDVIIKDMEEKNIKEFVIFEHETAKTYYTDYDEVRDEIVRETDAYCGSNKGIRSKPIILSLYSLDGINLTLVDLPGFTKIPVGDQPSDIEKQIHDLVTEHIKNPKSLILAVTPANVDFQTSEAIQMARTFDPDGQRTLGVLTKLDIIDKGVDIIPTLTGQLVEVKLGIIGVVNRSQEDIENAKPIEKALEDEVKFFEKRFPSLAKRSGQLFLAKKLCQLLANHISTCLPDLTSKVESQLSNYKKQLIACGDEVKDKPKTVVHVIKQFCDVYCNPEPVTETKKLVGGARIRYIFHDSFAKSLSKITPLDGLGLKSILIAARNTASDQTTITSAEVFKKLTIKEIEKLEEPSLACIRKVYAEKDSCIKETANNVASLQRFPVLSDKIVKITRQMLDEAAEQTITTVQKVFRLLISYIDVEHPILKSVALEYKDTEDFNGLKKQWEKDPSMDGDDVLELLDDTGVIDHRIPRNERDLRECQLMRKRIIRYFENARDEMESMVPRAIILDMIEHVRNNLHCELINKLHNEHMLDQLLSESDNIAAKRYQCKEMVKSLRQILDNIESVPTIVQA